MGDDREKFQSVCRSCSDEAFWATHEGANEYFEEHATNGHDVVIVNTEERDPIELE